MKLPKLCGDQQFSFHYGGKHKYNPNVVFCAGLHHLPKLRFHVQGPGLVIFSFTWFQSDYALF